MRRSRLLFLSLLLLAAGCRHAAVASDPGPVTPGPPALEAAARALGKGAPEAEEILASAGPEAVPHVRPLLSSPDPEVRLRALGLLIELGEPIELSPSELVDLAIFDLTRRERHPFAALRALPRVRELGEAALPRLEEISAGAGERALAARALLSRMGEVR